MSLHKIILGIDTGFASLGWALVELLPDREHVRDMGVLETKKSDKKTKTLACHDNYRRAQELHRGLNDLIVRSGAVAVCGEAMSFPRNANTSSKLGICWGVCAAVNAQHGLPMEQPTPQYVKKVLTGRRNATKLDIQEAIMARYPETQPMLMELAKTKREHAADAVGAVIASLNGDVLRLLRKM